MEFFELIIIALLAVVVILQAIILITQRINGKYLREIIDRKEKSFQITHDRQDRKDNSFRQHKQQHHDIQSKHQQPSSLPSKPGNAGNIESVEKSLRDINLKLKNAERDQEAARRKIRENLGKDHSRHRHHKGSNHRGGGKEYRQDRRDMEKKEKQQQAQQPSTASVSSIAPDASNAEPVVQPTPAPVLPDLHPVDYDHNNTEHGRIFTAKRHFINGQAPEEKSIGEAEIQPEQTASPATDINSSSPADETNRQPEQSGETEISFGRR